MGYTKEHREKTRDRILDSAATHFRRDGYDATRIDDVMAGAGLTRGGFYLHFDSKADLFAAYVGRELDFGRQLGRAIAQSPDSPVEGVRAALDFYLAPQNRKKVAQGCTIVSNAADVARGPLKTRKAFTRSFVEMQAAFEEAAADDADPEGAALSAIATCVGAVVLGRALADEATVERLLEACRENAGRILGER